MTRVKIRDVVIGNTGSINPTRSPTETFVYVDVAAVDNTNKVIAGAREILGADAPSRARKLIRQGDILVSTVRPNLNAVAMVPSHLDGQIASTGFCVLRASEKILSEYLYFYTRSDAFVESLSSLVAGAMYPAVTDSQVLDQTLPLPSIQEQRRIVDLLSRAEGIVRLRREAEKKAAELIPALFLDMFGDPATNPKGWPTQSIKNLVTFVSGGTPSKSRDDFWVGDLPWVSPKDMKRVGIEDAIDHVNRKVLTETSIKLIPLGSVLIVVRGMILIHTVPVGLSLVPLTINQDMKALVPNEAVVGDYLLWLLKVSQPRLLGMVATAAHGTKKLETEDLERFVIPIPPVTKQNEFIHRVREIESIQSQQSFATAKAQATFDALLAQAFQRTE